MKKFVVTRRSRVQSFLDAEEVVDLPSMVIDELIRMKQTFGCRNDEESKMVNTLIKYIHPGTGLGLPNQPLGGYDPITSWEYDAARNLYYLTRSAAGRVGYERNQLMCLSRFDLADIATLRLQNPTNDLEAQMVERVMLKIYKEDIDNLNAVADVRKAEEESRKRKRMKSQAKRQQKRAKTSEVSSSEPAAESSAAATETAEPSAVASSAAQPSSTSIPLSSEDPQTTVNPEDLTLVSEHLSGIPVATRIAQGEEEEADESDDTAPIQEEGSPSEIGNWNFDDQADQFFIIRRNGEKTWLATEMEALQLSARDLERMYELIDEDRPIGNDYRSLAKTLRRIHDNATQLAVPDVIEAQPLAQYVPITSWSFDHQTGLYRIARVNSASLDFMETQLFGLSRREIQDLASLPLYNPSGNRLAVLTEATIKILAHQR